LHPGPKNQNDDGFSPTLARVVKPVVVTPETASNSASAYDKPAAVMGKAISSGVRTNAKATTTIASLF